MAKPFFYIVPRTSSTSLTNFLQGCFGPEQVFVRKVIEDVYQGRPVTSATPTPSLLRLKTDLLRHQDYKAFVVMAPFGVHRFVDEETDLFVTLREPVDRCLSLIRFMRAKHDLNSINAMVAGFGDDLAGMLKERSLICLRNEQTRMLGDIEDWTLSETSQTTAQENLAHFTGVFDFRDDGRQMHQIAKAYGVHKPPNFPRLNAAPEGVSLDPIQVDLLRAANAFDQYLYETATKEFAYALR